MDIQHLKYALEIERSRSISRAAEKLFVSQPFLSKAVRELESELGSEIFNRSSRGVLPTKKGGVFLARAREIVQSVEELERDFREDRAQRMHFEICVPIACYIAQAFVDFVRELPPGDRLRVDYHETNTMSTINHVAERDCNIGIIRYQTSFEDYYLRYLQSRDLVAEPLWSYEYHLVISRNSPLARLEHIEPEMLADYVEISHGDPTIPALSASMMTVMRSRDISPREIVVYERQSQFELLCSMPNTYTWASPTPRSVFEIYPLVQRQCSIPDNTYRDVLIYRKSYRLGPEDRAFVEKVRQTAASLEA